MRSSADRPRTPPVFRSVFVKLVAIMLAMAASLLLLVSGFFALVIYPNVSHATEQMVREYTRLFARGGPDLASAKRLSGLLDLEIAYEGPGGLWATASGLPRIEDVRRRMVDGPP